MDLSHNPKLRTTSSAPLAGLMVFMPYLPLAVGTCRSPQHLGDLGRRGIGDVWTMTVEEYLSSPRWRRYVYTITRNPIVLFSIAPLFVFLCLHRVPGRTAPRRSVWSVWMTNFWVLGLWVTLSAVFGWREFLITQLLITLVGGGIGIWLFYVQHQFENAYWTPSEEWSYCAAALHGSSFYRLPKILQWFTGSIGFITSIILVLEFPINFGSSAMLPILRLPRRRQSPSGRVLVARS